MMAASIISIVKSLCNCLLLNPINNIDPDGRAVETLWDAANVALDATNLVANAASGNLLSAAVDAGALLVDAAATAVPFVPLSGRQFLFLL